MKWLDIKTAPKDGIYLTKVHEGVFGPGWQWYKTIRIHDKFFNPDTKEEIIGPKYWAKVTL